MPVITDVKCTNVTSLKIELNAEEIQFFTDVLNNIGGCPDASRRRIATSLRDALHAAGVNTGPRNPLDLNGSIFFEDTDITKTAKKSCRHSTRVDYDDARDEIPF